MRSIIKIEHAEHHFPELQETLAEAIDRGSVIISSLNKEAPKFQTMLDAHPKLAEAEFVIFAKEMKKYHQNESFVFVDAKGKNVLHLNGAEISLFGIILDEYCVDCEVDSERID